MARTGRPKKDKPANHVVTVKFNEDEYQEMLEYIKSHNISISQLIRSGVKMQISPDCK